VATHTHTAARCAGLWGCHALLATETLRPKTVSYNFELGLETVHLKLRFLSSVLSVLQLRAQNHLLDQQFD
jgi:hypothetical protein